MLMVQVVLNNYIKDPDGFDGDLREVGAMVYTATAEFNGETYTTTENVRIPATGHSYGEPV